jgi:hypothetical protein
MARLRPVPAARHTSPNTFVYKDLHDCTHVFLRQDATRRALEPPYTGPYQVFSRREETLQLLVSGKPVTVSADRIKPACVLEEPGHGSPTSNSPSYMTPAAISRHLQLTRLHAPAATYASPHA